MIMYERDIMLKQVREVVKIFGYFTMQDVRQLTSVGIKVFDKFKEGDIREGKITSEMFNKAFPQ